MDRGTPPTPGPGHGPLPRLHERAARGDAGAVAQLLADGHSPFALDPVMGASALHYAAQGGRVEVARLLLRRGAFLNLQTPRQGLTALMVAVWHRHPEMVGFLLEQPAINIELRATFRGTARGLIDFGADPDDAEAQEEARVMRAHFDAYATRRTADLEQQSLFAVLADPAAETAIKQARAMAELAAGAPLNTLSPITSSGNDGHTPLLVAARDGHAGTVAALLDAGADPRMTDHYMSATPVHKAAYMGHARVLEVLVADPRVADILDAQGPFNGYTALHDAVWHGHLEAARVLLAAGARTDLRGYDGRTPADMARDYGYAEIAALLAAA